ncbi:MAG TPA: immunoglobulin-like domain-containing protein, partial [Spirochaetota bacterium]|nr:immunoglobulin-like domain-containing protein [Spirochaetota bacterium]
ASTNLGYGDTWTDPGASAMDDIDGDISTNIVSSGDTVDESTPGTYVITYDVQDAAGNSALQVSRTVNVIDSDPPVITLSGSANMSIYQGQLWIDPGASASDDFDGSVSVNISGDTVDTNTPGTYTITYDAQDTSGNDAVQKIRTVTVIAAYRVIYHTAVSTGGSVPVDTNFYTNNASATVLANLNNLTNKGDTLSNWTNSSGYYFPGETLSISGGDVDLYANWTAAYKLRDRGPAYGWVFYDKGYYSDGWRYIEAASNNQGD